jgi:phosphoribosylformimino-5-aminoimidazole carboxamide ribotide isomerase
MEILPVLDLLDGVVVRGVAGRRSEYRPLRSNLTSSIEPLEVARAMRLAFGFERFYLADLDAIMHHRPNGETYRRLIEDGFQLLVDAGIGDVESARSVSNLGAEPIVGLESCSSPQALSEIAIATRGNLTFSLDLQHGRPMLASRSEAWSDDPLQIARQAVEVGVSRMIVLDLADVGTSSGGQTDSLCRLLLQQFPSLQLTCGGGVRGIEDLRRLKSLGAAWVLVASALHDGRLSASDCREFRSG